MALPEQIRKQTEAVQELYKQLNADENTGSASAQTDSELGVGTSADGDAAGDATQVLAEEHVQATTNDVDSSNDDSYAQKWRTLQGMYNAEVPRLHQQNREMTQRMQQMEQLLASVSAQPTAPQAQATVDRLVSDKDVEDYGESLDVMRKVSREELYPVAQRLAGIEQMLRQMQTSVVPQVQAVAQRQQVSAEQQFWGELTAAVPNFREINGTEAFQSWLLSADPLTGITRQTYLEDAQRSLDSRRVANFFHSWLETTGQANVAQPNGRSAAASELERQVAPGRSRGAGASAVADKGKVYTPGDIQKFFNDVRAGKYKGREQDRDRIERDIFAAQRESRIQMSA